MKKMIALISALVLVGALSQALAQPEPGGGDPTDPGLTNNPPPPPIRPDFTNPPPPWWTNVPAGPAGTNFWWTNLPPRFQTNLPPVWTNSRPRQLPLQPPAAMPPRLQPPPRPADVQTMIQKFKTDSGSLMNQLKNASAEQRTQILQQMEEMRLKMREQMGNLREQAKRQGEEMRRRFGNTENNRRTTTVNPSGTAGTGGSPR